MQTSQGGLSSFASVWLRLANVAPDLVGAGEEIYLMASGKVFLIDKNRYRMGNASLTH